MRVANHDASIVLKASEEAFDFPTKFVPAPGGTVLGGGPATIPAVRSNHAGAGYVHNEVFRAFLQ